MRGCGIVECIADVAELVDAPGLGLGGREVLGVRVPPSAHFCLRGGWFFAYCH